jgi:hypothetical protein
MPSAFHRPAGASINGGTLSATSWLPGALAPKKSQIKRFLVD